MPVVELVLTLVGVAGFLMLVLAMWAHSQILAALGMILVSGASATVVVRNWRERVRRYRNSRGLSAEAPPERVPRSNAPGAIFHIRDARTGVTSDVVTAAPAMEGWNALVTGWSIGDMASAADVKIDEPLDGIALGIFPASNHIILWGSVEPGRTVPEIACGFAGAWVREPALMTDGCVEFRFDRHPLRIGRHEITLEVRYAGAEPVTG